jgi:two-component system, LytTR family, response regulator
MTARALIEEHQPHLLFLDIAMPGESGLDFLKTFDTIPFEVIFATAHDEYVLQAKKPIDAAELKEAVSNVSRRLLAKESQLSIKTLQHNLESKKNKAGLRLCVSTLKGFQVLDIHSILYCEADHNYTNFVCTGNNRVVASRPLVDYETLLQDNHFFRVHKSTLINLNQVKEYIRGDGGEVIMNNGTAVTVSRRRKDEFLEKMRQLFKF